MRWRALCAAKFIFVRRLGVPARDSIGDAMALFATAILPFFERQCQSAFGDNWRETLHPQLRHDRHSGTALKPEVLRWDAQAVLGVMWDCWNEAFRSKLGLFERSLVSELREFRNRWAHQGALNDDDAYRVYDTVERLLMSVGETRAAQRAAAAKDELLAERFRAANRPGGSSMEQRRKRVDVAVYVICALSMCLASWLTLGHTHRGPTLLFMGFVVFTFSYLSYQRWATSPATAGVHECQRCRRVIYSAACPYCETSVAHLERSSEPIS